MKHLRWIVALLIGFAIGFFVAPSHIEMIVRNDMTLLLHPKKYDVIEWRDETGMPVTVSFTGDRSPCWTMGSVSKCTVVASAGVYPYNCAGDTCDPGIGVGSDVIELGAQVAATPSGPAAAGHPNPNPQTVSCDASNKATGVAITASVNQLLEWSPGAGSVGKDWTVTVDPSVCDNNVLKDHQVCKIKPGAQSNSYQIAGTNCTASASGVGMLTIQ